MKGVKTRFERLLLQKMRDHPSNFPPRERHTQHYYEASGCGNDGREYRIRVNRESGEVVEDYVSPVPVREPRKPIVITHDDPKQSTNLSYWAR